MYIFKNSLENKLQHMTMWLKKFMHVDNIIINLTNNIFYLWKHYYSLGLANDWKDEYAYIYFISSFDYRKLMIN